MGSDWSWPLDMLHICVKSKNHNFCWVKTQFCHKNHNLPLQRIIFWNFLTSSCKFWRPARICPDSKWTFQRVLSSKALPLLWNYTLRQSYPNSIFLQNPPRVPYLFLTSDHLFIILGEDTIRKTLLTFGHYPKRGGRVTYARMFWSFFSK